MLDVRDVSVRFGEKAILRRVTLDVAAGEIVCLLGASGSGKTTLLRTIVGLVKPDSGDVLLNGSPITDVPVHQRGFGLMFQDFALFPHLDVERNVAFGLQMQRLSQTQRAERVKEVLALVGLSGFEKRDVASLSGGERQRVALARSLAPSPRLLLLDEPLGSLDAALRERLVIELHDIIKSLGVTAIYVTHDQQEAFALADRMAIMHAGQIEQVGTPQELYRRPRTAFIARFLGLDNVIAQHDAKRLGILHSGDQSPYVLLHPDGLWLGGEGDGSISGVIEEAVFQGDRYRLRVKVADKVVLTMRVPADAAPQIGKPISIHVAPEYLIPLSS